MTDSTPHKDLAGRVTPAEFSRRLGVSKPAVSKAIRAGRIRLDEDGLLDPVQAELDWLANTRPKAQSAIAKGKHANSGYAQARARKENALASMAELRVRQAAGELYRRDDVRYVLHDMWKTLVTRLEDMPFRIAPVLASMNSFEEIHKALADEIDRIRHEVADRFDEQARQAELQDFENPMR